MPISNGFEFFIQLHLTERCNLSCRHCYQTGDRPEEMSLSEIKAVIAEVSDMIEDWTDTYNVDFNTSFNVTGGEPFLRQDIFNILEELGDKGFDTYLLSNGILINRERAEALASLRVKGVQVSVEGPEHIHDAIRGKGSLSASLKGVRHLLNAGVEVTLNTTLSDINASHFRDVIALASSTGVRRLGFSRLVPSGRGEEMADRMLKAEVLEGLYRDVFSSGCEGMEIVTGDPVATQIRGAAEDPEAVVPTGGCAAGVSGLTILPDGTVTPCRRLPIPIGNARTDSLREVWSTSEVLNQLRDRSAYRGRCGRCNKWSVCRGCRAIAYACSASADNSAYLEEDPQCFLGQENRG